MDPDIVANKIDAKLQVSGSDVSGTNPVPITGPTSESGNVPISIKGDLPTNNSVFRDEFDGPTLDPLKWSLVQTGSGMATSFLNSKWCVKTGTTADSETILRSVNKYKFESIFKWSMLQNLNIAEQQFIVEAIDTPLTKITGATWTKVTHSGFNFTSVSGSNILVINSGTPVVGAYVAGTNIAASSFIMAIDGATAILNNNASGSATNNTTSHLSLQIDTSAPHGLSQFNWIELCATSDASVFGYATAATGTHFIVTAKLSDTSFYIIPNNGTFAGGAGPGTLSFYPYTNQNIVQWLHDGTSATVAKFQVWTNGFSYTTTLNAVTGITQTTAANPGMNAQFRCNDGVAHYSDLGINSTSANSLRAVRENAVPAGSTEGYIQIRIKNIGAPSSSHCVYFDYFRVLVMDEIPVFMAGRGVGNAKEAISASVINTQTVQGANAHDSSTVMNPVVQGQRGVSALITAVTSGDTTIPVCDLRGRQLVYGPQAREMSDRNAVTLSSSTSETTLIAAVASVLHDIVELTLVNTSATATRIDIRDATAGTIRWAGYVAAGTSEHMVFPQPLAQGTANNNWTVQSSASVADVRVYVVSVRS